MNGVDADPTPTAPSNDAAASRARPLWTRAALLVWLILLAILLEYALSSFAEIEPQAGILAGAIFVGFLVAGLVAILVYNVSRDFLSDNTPHHQPPDDRTDNGGEHGS